jgi:hypothetical protein
MLRPFGALAAASHARLGPFPTIKHGCRTEQRGVPGAASGGVVKGQRYTSRR